MKTAKTILVVLFALSFAQIASAYYSPSTGRWLSRDPIVEPGFQALQNATPQVAGSALQPRARWVIRDPIGETSLLPGQNPEVASKHIRDARTLSYDFVVNNPVSQVDYLGLENVQLEVTTIIRPPDYEQGAKTIHSLTVNDKGQVVSVIKYIGATSVAGFDVTGFGYFEQDASMLYKPVVGGFMKGLAHSAVLPSGFDISYYFDFTLDFCKREGTLYGSHGSYPSYVARVHGQTIFDFQQHETLLRITNPILLWGGDQDIKIDNKFKF